MKRNMMGDQGTGRTTACTGSPTDPAPGDAARSAGKITSNRMNPNYLGDSYDIVKQNLLRWLADTGTWTTHPMFTEPLSAEQADVFSRLLGSRLLSCDTLTCGTDRDAYLAPARDCKDHVFLDPDTGIRLKPTRGVKAPCYLFGTELVAIVPGYGGQT